MAVQNGMFIFEVVVESVQSLVESRYLIIKSDFADVFSLELKDPKQLHIVMPEPPPLPPEPVGKKGKKKKPPKPKKGKKGKGVPAPPPEPVIQAGQSVLFSSNAAFLIQNMKKNYLEVSLWSKEDNLVYIGSSTIPWDPIFITYLQNIANSLTPEPVIVRDSYNVFEEGKAKIMAKLAMQVKLSYLGEKVSTAFRTLSEDPTIRKCLYTGLNSKNTSYMCTMKTTDEDFENNCNKIDNKFIVDKPKPKIVYADYKNAPGANLTFFNDGEYCCMGQADKPPESIYKSPETCPDVDFIIDYVRKIIVSCNDNMRMLTPRSTINPRIKATDIDRLCYCKETKWPEGSFAERFKNEAQSEPCPQCIDAGQRSERSRGPTFDIANIRGPCGRHDCKIARDLRAYVENLVEEDNKEFNINEVIGPCGSKSCTLAEKIQEFLRHEGVFNKPANLKGLSTQCACVETMQKALEKKTSCDALCEDCDDSNGESDICDGKICPFRNTSKHKVYDVYYFTVEHYFDKDIDGNSSPSAKYSSIYKHCSSSCPSSKMSEPTVCTKSACSTLADKDDSDISKCKTPVCPSFTGFKPSPADSNVVLQFKDIKNPCCVKSCDVSEKVKDFIVDAVTGKRVSDDNDPCYCDCVCDFKMSKNTTYCNICGGYECMGEDMKNQPSYVKPHPCPVYHKLYDKNIIKTPAAWPEDDAQKKAQADNISMKSLKTSSKTRHSNDGRKFNSTHPSRGSDKKSEKQERQEKKKKKVQKKVGKFTANVEAKPTEQGEKSVVKYPYPAVPRNMGWSWNADDIPGMKPRPNWKPGAANKILVRRYRAMREGLDVIAKKKRALLQRKKKIESKPTIIVTKRDGEYTVQMEVFKKYSKERLLFQYPYDDKPPLIYTIGKTELEKRTIKSQRDRRERREIRRKSRLLQSTFRDKCQEICLKAYNQALGVLPLPNPNSPECPCNTAPDPKIPPPVDSCSCSEAGTISSSDTDNDEWTIEFSPPAAKYDGKAKHPPYLTDNDTQYTYLDYKIKLLDKSGNQVPRFFKGPDGKQECSDLGGFWTSDKHWMEINKDGFIAPDNRWVPMNFIGPDGMCYSAEEGFFTDTSGQVLKIGIDGYVNKEGKWAWYTKRKGETTEKSTVTQSSVVTKTAKPETEMKSKGDDKAKSKDVKEKDKKTSPPTTKNDKNGKTKKVELALGKGKNNLVMSASLSYDKNRKTQLPYSDRIKLDAQKIAKYKEIMKGLQMYEDFYDLRPLMKTNRATQNSINCKISTYGGLHKNMVLARHSPRSIPTSMSTRSCSRSN